VHRLPRRSAPLAATVLTLLALAPGASAHDAGSITHGEGAVQATLAWDAAGFGVANPRLTIARAGADYAPPVADVCGEGCILAADGPSTPPAQSMLKVADLDGDDEPEVVVDTFSGGAHCCLDARLYRWTGAGYARTTIGWGDLGYQLKDLDADEVPEMVGNDPAFSAAFSSFAASWFPPRVLRWSAGTVDNVTKKFPALVRTDLAALRKRLRKNPRGERLRSLLAAYVADRYLLDEGAKGLREVDRQRRLGRVGKSYKKQLLAFLRKSGYR
jgi:hypothetical protein